MSTAPIPIEKVLRKLLAMLGPLAREKAHGQIVLTLRDGHVVLLTVQRMYRLDSLPES